MTSYATGRAEHKHGLAGFQCAAIDDRVMRGSVGKRDGRRAREVDVLGKAMQAASSATACSANAPCPAYAATRMPTAIRVTFVPTSRTTSANSAPGVNGSSGSV
jgi:hypothetical protein